MRKQDPVAKKLSTASLSQTKVAHDGRPATVVDGLFAIANALKEVANAIQNLAVANTASPMDASKVMSKEIKDSLERLSGVVTDSSSEEVM